MLGALGCYPGSTVAYLLFSAVFLVMLVSAFYWQRTYGYTFLIVMLWLGFWLKTTWHVVMGTGFPEPTGQFAGVPEEWDRALIVATAAGLGVLSARLGFHCLAGGRRQTLRSRQGDPPLWLKLNRNWHWGIFALLVTVTSIANFHYEIFVIGFKVGTILPWPLNALITLMLAGGGFSLWMATLMWHEVRCSGRVFFGAIILIVAALIITSFSLSRGMIVMLLIPIAYSLYLNSNFLKNLTRRKSVLLFLVLIGAVMTNFFVITYLRDGIYYLDKAPVVQSEKEKQFPSVLKPMFSLGRQAIGAVNFSIDRWVGIEGVMAVSTYPELGGDLLRKAMVEPLVQNNLSLYAEVAPWSYRDGDKLRPNVGFISLPGGPAFLYYSGSLMVVFALTAMLVLALQFSEVFAYAVTQNPILCASVGWTIAVWFAHFGGTPRAQLPAVLFLFSVITLLGLLHSKWLDLLVVRGRKLILPF